MTVNHSLLHQDNALFTFSAWYADLHGWVSVVVCSIGIVFNIFTIIVLTRKNMITSTNVILTGLAVSDLLTMVSYEIFAIHFYCRYGLEPSPARNTYLWAWFFLFHVNFTVTVHTVSIWLGVTLAIFRYMYVRLAAESQSVYNVNRMRLVVLAVYIGSCFMLLPNYLSLTMVSSTQASGNATIWDISSIPSSTIYGYVINQLNFWTHAVLIKLIPCGLMCVFGFLLVCTMRLTQKRRDKLTAYTKVLVIVLFLATELPQGILAVCSGLIPGFFEAIYMPLGDLMDVIALINNGINFTLYCSMSRSFRVTFVRLFCPAYKTQTEPVNKSFPLATRNLYTREDSVKAYSQVNSVYYNTDLE